MSVRASPRAWTPEEDRKLLEIMRTEAGPEYVLGNSSAIGLAPVCLNWKHIAAQLPGRTNKGCRKRWMCALSPKINRGHWSFAEDKRLITAVKRHSFNVSRTVGTRSPDQCSRRWNDALNPMVNRSAWTPEEDKRLCQAVLTYGHCWSFIARKVCVNRTGLAAKNRWQRLHRRVHRFDDDKSSKMCTLQQPQHVHVHVNDSSSVSGSGCTAPRSQFCADEILRNTTISQVAASKNTSEVILGKTLACRYMFDDIIDVQRDSEGHNTVEPSILSSTLGQNQTNQYTEYDRCLPLYSGTCSNEEELFHQFILVNE